MPSARPSYPAIVIGFALGALGAWCTIRRPPSTRAIPAEPSRVVLAGWDWRSSATPPPLASDAAEDAIAAWLDMREPGGAATGFAVRAQALRALLTRLPAEALPHLLTPLSVRAGTEDSRLLRMAFDFWVEQSPGDAAKWALTLPSTSTIPGRDLVSRAAYAWAQVDPLAAAQWACSLTDESLACDLAQFALRELANRDPAKALALASSRGEPFLKSIGFALLEGLAATDPAAALRTYGPLLWKEEHGFWGLKAPLEAWMARDATAALIWVLAFPHPNDANLVPVLETLHIRPEDRVAIATALATVPGVPDRYQVLRNIVANWADDDPAATLAWLDSLPDADTRTRILEQAAGRFDAKHPEASLSLALAMPESSNRTSRLTSLLSQWASGNPAAALAWINAHDDPGVAAGAAGAQAAILATIARDEPATAVAEWEKLSDPRAKSMALTSIVNTWGSSDPGAALRWMTENRNSLSGLFFPSPMLISAWAQRDPTAALRWSESLRPAEQEFALEYLGGTPQAKADRATTADLYAQITNPDLRARVLSNHLREWLGKDPAAARTWIDTHNALTPEQVAKILQGVTTGG